MQPTAPTPESQLAEDPFRYGWRDVSQVAPDGSETRRRLPLTLEDVLYPQEGDFIVENNQHELDRRYLADVFSSRPLAPRHAAVTCNLGVHWGVENIGNHAPDVAVFVGLSREVEYPTGLLDFADLGGRCELIVEVVSPSTRINDVVYKFNHYHLANVAFYVIIDREEEDGPRVIRAYRHTPEMFVSVELDAHGQLLLPLLNLRLQLRGHRVICFEAATGRELGDYTRLVQELQANEQKLEEQDQAMEVQILARQEAERRARDAEQEADRQRQARELADKQAEQAAQRVRDLEALLRTLQAGAAGDPGQAS